MKNFNFIIFFLLNSINFSHILRNNKKSNTVTPQFFLSFGKGMPNTTKYYKSRKMARF